MPSANECLQTSEGPTPCFRDADYQICELNYCPARKFFKAHPEKGAWYALNHHCVVAHPYDYRGVHQSIQLALIAQRRKK